MAAPWERATPRLALQGPHCHSANLFYYPTFLHQCLPPNSLFNTRRPKSLPFRFGISFPSKNSPLKPPGHTQPNDQSGATCLLRSGQGPQGALRMHFHLPLQHLSHLSSPSATSSACWACVCPFLGEDPGLPSLPSWKCSASRLLGPSHTAPHSLSPPCSSLVQIVSNWALQAPQRQPSARVWPSPGKDNRELSLLINLLNGAA